jgi:hypothetical protein
MPRALAEIRFFGAMALALTLGCDRPASWTGDEVAEAQESLVGTYCIFNARIAPGSFHFDGPTWLLDSAEGQGPRSLDLSISSFVQPQISTNTTAKPGPDDVSEAVGYSVTTRFQIQASSSIDVDAMHYQRLEAYTAFQQTYFEIRDPACAVIVGAGSAYKPIGIYFQTRNAFDVSLPDVGIYTFPPPVIPVVPLPGGAGGAGSAGGSDGAGGSSSASASSGPGSASSTGGGEPADAGAGD